MADRSLADLAEKMRDIDFTMLSTKDAQGRIHARPMSNNRDVDYEGDSFFFAEEHSAMVREIESDPHVGLGYQGRAGILGQRPFFAAIEGSATLIRDKAQFAAHWTSDLDGWFERGVDTPGLVLIKVSGHHAHWWDGKEQGELLMEPAGSLT